MLTELVKAFVLGVGGFVAITLVMLGLRILFADNADYSRNKERSGGLLGPLVGRIPTRFNGSRDFRVKAGLAINRKNQWVEQGALSEEAIDTVLAKK